MVCGWWWDQQKKPSQRWRAADPPKLSNLRMNNQTLQSTSDQTESSNLQNAIITRPHRLAYMPAGHRYFPDCQRETYARWIEWSMWSGHPKPGVWFVSLTFKTYVYEKRAFTILKKWLGHLRQAYEDRPAANETAGSTRRGQLRWIIATEWQIREVVHFHLLISGLGLSELSRKRWEVRWMSGNWNAGICRIYDADRKAAPYLAKYIQKGNELTWGGYWRGLTTPNSVACCQPNLRADLTVTPRADLAVESPQGIQATG